MLKEPRRTTSKRAKSYEGPWIMGQVPLAQGPGAKEDAGRRAQANSWTAPAVRSPTEEHVALDPRPTGRRDQGTVGRSNHRHKGRTYSEQSSASARDNPTLERSDQSGPGAKERSDEATPIPRGSGSESDPGIPQALGHPKGGPGGIGRRKSRREPIPQTDFSISKRTLAQGTRILGSRNSGTN